MIRVERTEDLETCLAIRRVVFIEEQRVPDHEEMDGRDADALHLIAHADGRPVGTARVLIGAGTGKIGRVAVLRGDRGTGAGKALVLGAIDLCRREGVSTARLGAQTHALGFYEVLGFRAVGPEFIDAGIPHREMVLDL